MNTTNGKIIEIVEADDLVSFKSFLNSEEVLIKKNYPSILNALLFQKRDQMLIELFNSYPEFLEIKTKQGYNIAHVFAVKNLGWGVNFLKSLDNSLFLEKNNQDLTPFYLACTSADGKLWDFFLNHPTSKEQINQKLSSNISVTPLYLATYASSNKKVEDLIKIGADVNQAINGVSALDVALTKNNWQVIGSLVSKMDIISPKFVLHAVKNYPDSEGAMQAFIDDINIQDKIFPLSKEDKLPVWSYFFYYANADFIKKNENFLHERFIPDLNKNDELKNVIYSCFLGKRDSLEKIEWLLSNTKIEWVNSSYSVVENKSTFGKTMPKGFASFVDKLNKEELEKLVKKLSKFAPNLTDEDKMIINVSLISRGLNKIDDSTNKKGVFNRDLLNALTLITNESVEPAHPIQYMLMSALKKIPNDIIRVSSDYLFEVCKTFKVDSDVLYKPFVEELQKSSNPNYYFKNFLDGAKKHQFMRVVLKTLLKSDEDNYSLLKSLSDLPSYKQNLKNLIVDDGSKSRALNIKNFNFPADFSISWNDDDFSLNFSNIFAVIASNKYSSESLKILDKLNKSSIQSFDLGDPQKRKQKFYYQDFIKSINLGVGVNEEFLDKVNVVFAKSPNLIKAINACIVIAGNENVTEKAYEKALDFCKSLDSTDLKEMINSFSFVADKDKIQTGGMVELLSIAHKKDINISEVFWQNFTSSKIEALFYVKSLSKMNDFSYFFDFVPLSSEVNSFKYIVENKTQELKEYFSESAIDDWLKSASNFSNKDAIFMGLEVIAHLERDLTNKEIEKLETLINNFITLNNYTNITISFSCNEIIDTISKNVKDEKLIIDLYDKTNLSLMSEHKNYIEKRAYHLKNILDRALFNSDSISLNDDTDNSNEFKI